MHNRGTKDWWINLQYVPTVLASHLVHNVHTPSVRADRIEVRGRSTESPVRLCVTLTT